MDKASVIKIIDEARRDFEYDDVYGVIAMRRIRDSARKPTDSDLNALDNRLSDLGIQHGDLTAENVLWDEQMQMFQVIDFGCASCGYQNSSGDSFVDEVQNEVSCQKKASAHGLSPAIRAFWFVRLDRAPYVLPPKNFTDDERSVLFGLFSYFYDRNYIESESVRFVVENGGIKYVNEQGRQTQHIRHADLVEANREDPSWLADGGFTVLEDGFEYGGQQVAFFERHRPPRTRRRQKQSDCVKRRKR